jgi:hypothetical protein
MWIATGTSEALRAETAYKRMTGLHAFAAIYAAFVTQAEENAVGGPAQERIMIRAFCLMGFLVAILSTAGPPTDPRTVAPRESTAEALTPETVMSGLKDFYRKTARADGSFQPGIDPEYRGMSDAAYSDLAAVTYAVTIHKTFGWKLPHEEKTVEFLLARQKPSGDFFNVGGTVDPALPEGRVYNTTQALVRCTRWVENRASIPCPCSKRS